MAQLVIREAKSRAMMRLPHLICLNGQTIGVLGKVGKEALRPQWKTQSMQANITLPAGKYTLRIQSMLKWFSSTIEVEVHDELPTIVEFGDKEFWWDLLFWGDMVAWLLKLILHIGRPWSIVYEVVSDITLVIWLVHEYRIRNNYFEVKAYEQVRRT